MNRLLTFHEAILEAQYQCLEADPSVYLIGLGVPDPRSIFATTKGLQETFGANRVLDMPLSENTITGVTIGSSLVGMRPVMTHQRVDFALLAMEQLVNQAAKWRYMFDGQHSVPAVYRLIIGRGWGQGPQHSQNLQALFAHIPGLKVVMPTTAHDVKGMMIAAIEDNDPVVILEHRWLYNIKDTVPEHMYRVPLNKAQVVREGTDVTIVSTSHMTLEALRAADTLASEGISTEIVDLRSLRPIDDKTIMQSVKKTGHLIAVDTGWSSCGISAEILALVAEIGFGFLKSAPIRIAMPDEPVATSWQLARHQYPRHTNIIAAVFDVLGREFDRESLLAISNDEKLDTPDLTFTGPF